MVSSTFTDLKDHRAEVIGLIDKLGFKAVVMEHSGAQPADLITSSLAFVNDCAAYVLLISHKYGQIPKDPRNPDGVSITELEFNEAVRLKRPRLLFVMANNHPVTIDDIEPDPDKKARLDIFKARAKLMNPGDVDSDVSCVYEEFSSPADLAKKAAVAIGNLAKSLGSPPVAPAPTKLAAVPAKPSLPKAPALRALPDYIGSHRFLGRESELQTLDDWAGPADPNPILLFEAIGGSGKSILTWHWLNYHAPQARDWAGRFWYSFYERGATMADFCRQALSYITGHPAKHFHRMRMPDLSDWLVRELQLRPWLLILDGLERILVQYNRLDAAQMRDEEAGSGTDPIANRDPCQAIRPDDDALLRRLTTVAQSKLLVSTRLLPIGLTNRAGATLPGVKRELLAGLRPTDAEDLFRACGVHGDSARIRAFLQANCDCHPLVVGALAGLVNGYLPDKGNFDRWVDDPDYGGKLNLADLNLTGRREHILKAAVAALTPEGRKLLQMLALLLGGAEYAVLEAFNPHAPQMPQEVHAPRNPEDHRNWPHWSDEERARENLHYERAKVEYDDYQAQLAEWKANPAVRSAPRRLRETVRDLERRGLLQYDRSSHRYDLHPVVRGITAGGMNPDERTTSGGVVIDYFSARTPDSWEEVKTSAEVANGVQLITTLIGMGEFERALVIYRGDLSNALAFNLEAHSIQLSLLRGWFNNGWYNHPSVDGGVDRGFLLNEAGIALLDIDKDTAKFLLKSALLEHISEKDPDNAIIIIFNMIYYSTRCQVARFIDFARRINDVDINHDSKFLITLVSFENEFSMGNYDIAQSIFTELRELDIPLSRSLYRPGVAELYYADFNYRRGMLTAAMLQEAEQLASAGNNRYTIRRLVRLRGRWSLEQGEYSRGIESLNRAVSMAREIGLTDELAEVALVLARFRNGDCGDAREEAERLANASNAAALYLCELWRELGEPERAVAAALRAHEWAKGDGEPYVWRWELDRAEKLLIALGTEPPPVPVHDPASVIPYPWEADVRAFIRELEDAKAQDEAEDAREEPEPGDP